MGLEKNTEKIAETDHEGEPGASTSEKAEERPKMKFELQILSPTRSEASVPSLNESVSTAVSQNKVNTPQLPQFQVPVGSKVVKNVSHNSSSLTWQSSAHSHKEEFQKYKRRVQRMYKPSAFVPWSALEWNAHLSSENERRMREENSKMHALQKVLEERKLLRALQKGKGHVPKAGERIKTVSSGRGVVLAQTSIWCPLPAQRHGGRIWPSREELRYEGDERVATGYGRYLPIVRNWLPEQTDMPWDQVPALPPHWFDQFNKILSREDIYGEHTEIDDCDIPRLLNSDLLSALDRNDFDT